MNYSIAGNELIVDIDRQLFNEDVLFKCFYWYSDQYSVITTIKNELLFEVRMIPLKESLVAYDPNILFERIIRDLNDYKLRDIVTKETKNIRDLLVAKAFAYYDLEEDPTTEISDPVGFNPESINNGSEAHAF